MANSFAGLQAGARQVECAINGLGERAGNASLEEIVMLLRTREADVGFTTGINTREIARASRLVSRLTGYAVQPNKAIVGRNAFQHESGIHQDGVLKERSTFEIMSAASVGFDDANSIVLGKHSGRHALQSALMDLGYEVYGQTLNQAFKRFKELADKKKQVTAMDLEALVTDELRSDVHAYTLEWFDVEASTRRPPHATVSILTPGGRERARRLHRRRPDRRHLPRHQLRHPPRGAAARVPHRRRHRRPGRARRGQRDPRALGLDAPPGQGVSTDIIEAAALAYVRALSNVERKVVLRPRSPSTRAARAHRHAVAAAYASLSVSATLVVARSARRCLPRSASAGTAPAAAFCRPAVPADRVRAACEPSRARSRRVLPPARDA